MLWIADRRYSPPRKIVNIEPARLRCNNAVYRPTKSWLIVGAVPFQEVSECVLLSGQVCYVVYSPDISPASSQVTLHLSLFSPKLHGLIPAFWAPPSVVPRHHIAPNQIPHRPVPSRPARVSTSDYRGRRCADRARSCGSTGFVSTNWLGSGRRSPGQPAPTIGSPNNRGTMPPVQASVMPISQREMQGETTGVERVGESRRERQETAEDRRKAGWARPVRQRPGPAPRT